MLKTNLELPKENVDVGGGTAHKSRAGDEQKHYYI